MAPLGLHTQHSTLCPCQADPEPGLGQARNPVPILNAVTVNKDSGTFCWRLHMCHPLEETFLDLFYK